MMGEQTDMGALVPPRARRRPTFERVLCHQVQRLVPRHRAHAEQVDGGVVPRQNLGHTHEKGAPTSGAG